MNDTSRPGEERPANEIQPRTGELAGSVARASDAPLGLMDGPAAEAAGRFTTTENVGVRIVVDYLNAHGTRAPILDLYALLTGSRAPLAAPPKPTPDRFTWDEAGQIIWAAECAQWIHVAEEHDSALLTLPAIAHFANGARA